MILSGQADQAIPILNKVLTSPLDIQEKAYAYRVFQSLGICG